MKNIELIQKEKCIEIKLNFLGGIVTHAVNEADVDIAIEEAILCFIQASKLFGKGLYQEFNF